MTGKNAGTVRLESANEKRGVWKKLRPCLSERQWGTVRENFREEWNTWGYFHGNNGAGLGAIHQIGWTGSISRALHLLAATTPEQALELGKPAVAQKLEQVVSR